MVGGRWRAAVVFILGAFSAACDPCPAITGCVDQAQFTITGRILRHDTAEPVAGARVDFIRQSGVALDVDSARTVTSTEGVYTLRVEAASSGLVTGDIVIRSAAGDPSPFGYRILDQTLRVFADIGDANVFPVWSTEPSAPDIALLVSSTVPAASLAGVSIEFRRTGGVALREGNVFQTVSRPDGVFELFDGRVHPVNAGEIVGDLFIDLNGGLTITGVRVLATPEFRRNAGLRLVSVDAP
jgi:hypothetical protein